MSELIEVKTIAEVENIVHASGKWDGTEPVEFSNDGAHFAETWMPTEENPHPQFARVTVHRKDVKIPTRKTIRWDEQYPAASEEWSGKWDRSPMRHFGRTVRMVAFRETFRDLLGNIVIEDEDHAGRPEEPVAHAGAAAERDWESEFLAAKTIEEMDVLEAEARAVRLFTPDAAGTALNRVMKAQRKRLVEAAWSLDHATTPEPASAPEPAPAAASTRRAPQDHLPPQNRAGRRAARRKGARR